MFALIVISAMDGKMQRRACYWSKICSCLTREGYFSMAAVFVSCYTFEYLVSSPKSGCYVVFGCVLCFSFNLLLYFDSGERLQKCISCGRKRENFHFSLDKVQFTKCKNWLSDTVFIFFTDIVDSYMGKKDTCCETNL